MTMNLHTYAVPKSTVPLTIAVNALGIENGRISLLEKWTR